MTRPMNPSGLDLYYRKKGEAIRRRLLRKSGSSQFRYDDLAKEVIKLRSENYGNWPVDRIAEALGVTPSGIYKALKKYEQVNQPRSAQVGKLKLPHAKMLEWSVEAFEAFFLEFSGFTYMPNHVKPWIEAFLKHRNLMLNVPPRHAKSTYFMIWVPIWLICRDRNVQILLISDAAEDAQTWALEIAGQLESNQGLINAYGPFKADKLGPQKWMPNSGTFSVLGRTKTARGAQFTVESRGMSGRVLGREADFVIVDDPTNQEATTSEAERKRRLEHLREQVFSRAEPQGPDKPGGRIVVIGQRVHLFDLYGELERQEWEFGPKEGEKLWHVEKYPAVLDWETKQVLWPERVPKPFDELMLTYARVGGKRPFFTLYQQEPLPEGTALVRQEWIEKCRDPERGARMGLRRDPTDAQVPVVRVLSVDPSPTKFNGIVVGDLACSQTHFAFAVTEVYRMKAGIRELKEEVDRIISASHPDYFIFEESGFLAWFREDPWFMALRERVHFVPHHTGVNKNAMDFGVQSLSGDFEHAQISLPYGDDEGRAMSDMLSNEALTWYEGIKEGYDLLMALWFVKFNYRNLRPLYALPTRRKGAMPGSGTWDMYRAEQKRKDRADAAYHRIMAERRRREHQEKQAEMRKVSSGYPS